MRWPWNRPAPSRSDQIGTPLPYPWWRRHWIVVTVAVLIVVGGGVGAAAGLAQPPNKCGDPGLVYRDSVCVGLDLSGRGFQGHDHLGPLEKEIAGDDQKITGDDYATIVFLDDMAPDPAYDSVNPTVLRHRVEGAIAAERAANDTAIADGPNKPRIKLLLANYGDEAQGEQQAVSAIERYRGAQHIVAVTGIGQSLTATQRAIADLSGKGITTVGSVPSGNHMDRDPEGHVIRNFFRVTSTDADEVRAGLAFARKKGYKRMLLIKDMNADDEYSQDLAADFVDDFKSAYPGRQPVTLPYNSPPSQLNGYTRLQEMEDQFSNMHSDICADKPDLIYFAGRGADLQALLTTFSQGGSCEDLSHVDLLSADDFNSQAGTPLPPQHALSFRVFYTAVATTGEWGFVPGDSADTQNYDQFERAFTGLARFSAGDLSDGHAIMEYDAFIAAATAARKEPEAVKNPGVLSDYFYRFDCQNPVPGASGRIAFYRNGDAVAGPGNPIDKAVPVVQIASDGKVAQRAMEWSDGKSFDDPAECGGQG